MSFLFPAVQIKIRENTQTAVKGDLNINKLKQCLIHFADVGP